MANSLSRSEIRDRLSKIGRTQEDVARELGVDRSVVRGVLSGSLKGTKGDAHKVAVSLGLKEGVIVPKELPIADAMKAAAR